MNYAYDREKGLWRNSKMLIIDGNSVYEIDEECLKKRKVPSECKVLEKVKEYQEREEERRREKNGKR